MKKIISVLLAAVLLVSAVPFAFAEGTGVYVTGSYESKVCQESYDLIYGPVPGVGTGDKITLFVYASVPVHVELDGNTLADLPAGSPSEASFTAGAEGDHTLTFTPQDGEAETLTFRVYAQREVYRRQLKDAAADAGALGIGLLAPLAALPLMLVAPPLGLAAFAVPLMSLGQFFRLIECAFRFVNLLRK